MTEIAGTYYDQPTDAADAIVTVVAAKENPTSNVVPEDPGTDPQSPFVQINGETYVRFRGSLIHAPDYGHSPGCDGDEPPLTIKQRSAAITNIIEEAETGSG